jgi:hypothetical protein
VQLLIQDYNFLLRSVTIIFVGFNNIMARFSLKEIYIPNSIFTPNVSLYDSSVMPVCFQTLLF